jgi:hypothetical protein
MPLAPRREPHDFYFSPALLRGFGPIHAPAGRPGRVKSLFKVVAEKIPFDCLRAVEYDMKDEGLPRTGIYLAHDSMGAVRYAGRGSIFTRLATRKKEQFLQLHYFSFYVILDKSTNARLRLW